MMEALLLAIESKNNNTEVNLSAINWDIHGL